LAYFLGAKADASERRVLSLALLAPESDEFSAFILDDGVSAHCSRPVWNPNCSLSVVREGAARDRRRIYLLAAGVVMSEAAGNSLLSVGLHSANLLSFSPIAYLREFANLAVRSSEFRRACNSRQFRPGSGTGQTDSQRGCALAAMAGGPCHRMRSRASCFALNSANVRTLTMGAAEGV
jgi:hypothetical protein